MVFTELDKVKNYEFVTRVFPGGILGSYPGC